MAPHDVILAADALGKHYRIKGKGLGHRTISAVDGVSLTLSRGESLGIVGESGCGKSTLARMLVGLEKPSSGTITFDGEDVTGLRGSRRRDLSRRIQMVFQDPYTSLNPRLPILDIVSEPLRVHRIGMNRSRLRDRVAELLVQVNLAPEMMNRYPHQFSGGQRQRIGIARALALEPDVLVCDEPVSALDVSVQAQVINLLRDLQLRTGIGLIFIAHDLSVVRHVSDRTMVMYLGRLAEIGPTSELFTTPAHPYTQALLSASPTLDRERRSRRPRRITLLGDPPSPTDPPSGCRFRTRCRLATPECGDAQPPLAPVGEAVHEHRTVCIHKDEALRQARVLAAPQLTE